MSMIHGEGKTREKQHKPDESMREPCAGSKVAVERNCKHTTGWREEQRERLLKSVDRKFTKSQEKREYDGKNSN